MASAFNPSTGSSQENQEKSETHIEHADEDSRDQVSPQTGFCSNVEELPKGYFTSSYFVGTILAIGLNLLCSTGGFALIAPVLTQIDTAIGPGQITWVSLVSSFCVREPL